MKYPIKILSCFLLIILITSCAQEVEIDTGEFVPRIVIEGYIENNEYPWINITNNQEFFKDINLDFTSEEGIATLLNLFVMDAEVTVTDGTTIDTLEFMIAPEIFEGIYVWPPVKYQGSKIIGEIGKAYYMKVVHNDKVYTATTTITEPLIPDSVWVEYSMRNDKDCWIHVRIHDNPDEYNYYNCYSKRLGKDNYFTECLLCLWNDQFFNGLDFEATVYRGSSFTFAMDTIESNLSDIGQYAVGDTVILKVLTMDAASFNFWQSTEQSNNPHSNINGDALGVWCGYGVYYTDPIIIGEKP